MTNMDTIENIEEYLESVENYFFSSLSAATTDMPNVQEAVNRLWLDISRYGPGMPEIHLPSLGNFQVPPPPPPPPPPPHLTWLSRSADCIGRHPWTTSAVVIGVAGAGLLLVYRTIGATKRNKYRIKTTSERQQVVGKSRPSHFSLLTSSSALIIWSQSSLGETHRSLSR